MTEHTDHIERLLQVAATALADCPDVRDIDIQRTRARRGGDRYGDTVIIHLESTNTLKVVLRMGLLSSFDGESYALTAWEHRRGQLWVIVADSHYITGDLVAADALPSTLATVLNMATRHPMSGYESAQLTGTPLAKRALLALQSEGGL